jgi:hypothetical protein
VRNRAQCFLGALEMAKLTPPGSLRKDGRAMWNLLSGSIEPDDSRGAHGLFKACQIEDDLVKLRAEIDKSSLLTVGSAGQQVANPLLGAVRDLLTVQQRFLDANRKSVGRRVARLRPGFVDPRRGI